MKKGIKYAGIAAATLLTLAPVAAPVVGAGTQTVQAAAETPATKVTLNTPATDTDKVDLFMSQYKNGKLSGIQLKTLVQQAVAGDFYQKDVMHDAFDADAAASAFNKDLRDHTIDNLWTNTSVKVSLLDANGAQLNKHDLKKIYKFGTGSEATVTPEAVRVQFDMTYVQKTDDKNQIKHNVKDFTFTNRDDVTPAEDTHEVKTLNASFENPLMVKSGSKTVNATLSTSAKINLSDQTGKEVKHDSVEISDIYKNKKAAINKSQETDDKLNDNVFGAKGNTYYQAVDVTISAKQLGFIDGTTTANSLNAIVNNYLAGEDGYAIKINGENAKSYEYKYDKGDDTANPSLTISYLRQVKVGDPASDWKVEDIDGIVTVGDKVASMVNTKNETVKNRSLGEDTAWRNDKKRTNSNGDVQYRVSTDEWVDAKKVSYIAKDENIDGNGNTTSPEISFTDVKDVKGKMVVKLDNAKMVYNLSKSNGKAATRGIAGDSSWLVDKTAKNSDGDTVYRVSTDEWLTAGEGLTVITD